MRAKDYEVLRRAVEEGVAYGWNRAHKHVANPNPEEAKDAIAEHVMAAVSEWFTFDRDEESG